MRALLIATLLCSACATAQVRPEYLAHEPVSILVLPPLNESPEVEAPRLFLSTVSRPLAERGFYVFPVAVVEQMMRENGLPGPEEMNEVPLEKLGAVFGADAVLYSTIESWGTTFYVVNSRTEVRVSCRLLDVRTGALLWEGSAQASRDSSGSTHGATSGGSFIATLIGMIAGAVVHQVAASVEDPSRDLAVQANHDLFRSRALPPGRHHPDHDRSIAAARER